mgnify:FL=1
MKAENRLVSGLWIGKHLSVIEQLCIRSFLDHAHPFRLWVYDAPDIYIKGDFSLADAGEIIPREEVFCYKNRNQFGHGKGSYAGFSDIFRYRLLHLYGGWWTDMDVVCLGPMDFTTPYVFRTHHDFPLVGNIMKVPPASELMKVCYERASALVNDGNTDWNLPIRILNEEVHKRDLQKYICEFSNQDSWRYIRNLLYRNPRIPGHWKALHLVNEEWRRNRIDKNAIPAFSYIGRKMRQHGISSVPSFSAVLKNYFRIVFPKSTFIQAWWLFVKTFWRFVRLFVREKPYKQGVSG